MATVAIFFFENSVMEILSENLINLIVLYSTVLCYCIGLLKFLIFFIAFLLSYLPCTV